MSPKKPGSLDKATLSILKRIVRNNGTSTEEIDFDIIRMALELGDKPNKDSSKNTPHEKRKKKANDSE